MLSRIPITALFATMVGAGTIAVAQADLGPFNLPLDEIPSPNPDAGLLANKMIHSKTAQGICTKPDDGGFLLRFSPIPGSTVESFGIEVILADGITQATIPIPILDLPLTLLLETLATEPFIQDSQTFGRNGEHTDELAFQHQLCKDFWRTDEEGENGVNVVLSGWHSEPLSELDQMKRAISAYLSYQNPSGDNFVSLLGLTDSDLTDIASAAMFEIESGLPDGYSNPLLSFNAFASPFVLVNDDFPGTIVMGDGIMDFLSSLGFDDVTNDVVHAHEFGHILQFIAAYEDAGQDIDEFIDIIFDVTPEESRRIELKADAYAAYFLAHEQGRNFEIPLLMQAAGASFSIGDCSVQSAGHHGTPAQRQCATLWGASQGLQNGKEPIPFRDFRDLFDENLPLILDVDPSVCSGELMEDYTSVEVKRTDDRLIDGISDQANNASEAVSPGEPAASEESTSSGATSPEGEEVELASSGVSCMTGFWTRLSILGALVAPLLLLS